MPINSEHLASLTDADVIDQNGDKVGGVGQIYLDDATGQPAWVSVKSGLFGLRESFVPLTTADVVDGNISVPFTKDFIKDAPRVDADNHLDDGQQATLYSYYGLERPTAGDAGGGADQTASFTSEQTAEEMNAGRAEGEPAPVADNGKDGAVPTEYTTTGATEASRGAGGGDDDLGSGAVSRDEPRGEVSAEQAAAIGAAGAAGVAGAGAAGARLAGSDQSVASDESPVADESDRVVSDESPAADQPDRAEPQPGDPDWDETAHATFQQENPAAQADWAAEQAPEEPVSTSWSVPPTDPADEEPTRVGRSGYASDRPAAHASAYEGHGEATAPVGAAPAEGTEPVIDQATDEGAVYAADADAARTEAPAGGSDEGDSEPFGSVEPVTTDQENDDAVTGAPDQTGTGYPAEATETPETTGIGAGGALAGGAAAGGVAAAGVAASDMETTAYEVPGQEFGSPTTDAEPGTEFAADREEPFDGSTEPEDVAGEDSEVFGATGYRPDRDGSEMTDEERERLNRARGAL